MTGSHALSAAVAAAAGVSLDGLSPEAVRHSRVVVADTVGVIVAGSRRAEIRALAAGLGRPGPASLVGIGATASGEDAAFINATAGTFLELDEGMRPTGHPAIHVVPAALAAAEIRGADLGQFLRAVIAGYEVTGRLFRAYRLTYPVHPHGHFGAIGAAVAVALLEDIDAVSAAQVAATTPLLSTWGPCYEGATARNTYTGQAAQSGLRACRLAVAGFTGSGVALDESFGIIAGDLVDVGALTAGLDPSGLAIQRNYFKRHSACALTHAALDAVLSLRPRVGDSGEAIAARTDTVLVETVRNNLKIARAAEPNSLSTRFSLPYAVAVGLLVGSTGVDDFEYRDDVAELAERVQVVVAEDLETGWPVNSAARVTIRAGGESFTRTLANPRGHHSDPLTESELATKFVGLVAHPNAPAWWNRWMDAPLDTAVASMVAP